MENPKKTLQKSPDGATPEIGSINNNQVEFRLKVDLDQLTKEAEIRYGQEVKDFTLLILEKYKFNSGTLSVIAESLAERLLSSYKPSKNEVLNVMRVYADEDVLVWIKDYEESLSGQEAHLISRLGEMGYEKLEERRENIRKIIQDYKNMPIFLETIFRMYLELPKEVQENIAQIGDKKEASKKYMEIYYGFWLDPEVRKRLQNEYNNRYFFLPELKNLILQGNNKEIVSYPSTCRAKLEHLVENSQMEKSVIKSLITIEELEKFVENESYTGKEPSWEYNNLLQDAVSKKLITQADLEEILKKISTDVQSAKKALILKLCEFHPEIPELDKNNDEEVKRFIISSTPPDKGYGNVSKVEIDWATNKYTMSFGTERSSMIAGGFLLSKEALAKRYSSYQANKNISSYVQSLANTFDWSSLQEPRNNS